MENTQVSKLKINATNIKNSLFRSNKELISLKKERLKISFTQEERKKISKKESSAESSSSFLQSVKNVGRTLISGPLSFIDKFKEFFGLILLGIVVNNLPAIVQKLQDTFIKIQTFFDQNPWIMDAVKFGFEIIGKGIMGLAKFIRFIGPYIGGSFKFALDTLKSARIQVEGLISTFVDLDLSFGKLAKDLNVDKIPDASKDPSRYSNFVAGGGKKALEEKGLTVDEVVSQGKQNISRSRSGPRSPQPQSQPGKPAQKLARGGTVGNIPPQEGTGRGGPSDIAKKKSTTPTTRSPFTKSESGGARRARESVNYFETFNKTLNETKENTILEKKNIGTFEEMTNNFKQFSELMQKLSTLSPGNRTRPGGSPSGADPIDVDPKEIVGYSGGVVGLLSSGRSTGPHIHMENGDGYSRSGGVIPSDVLQNVLVNGKPINSYGTSRDPNTGHEGYDFLTPAGLPVRLTGGLKFVEYDKATSSDNNSNFGDSLIIADSRGRKYLLAHMSGGPPNLQALTQKQNEQTQQRIQTLSGAPVPQTSGSGNRYTIAQVIQIAKESGFTGNNIAVAAAVAMAESAGDPTIDTVKSGTDPKMEREYSIGLWQINWKAHKNWLSSIGITNPDQLRNPRINALAAFKLSGGSNFNPWSTYSKNRKYENFLPTAQKELKKLQQAPTQPVLPSRASLGPVTPTGTIASLPISISGSSKPRDVVLVRQQTIVKDTAFISIPT